MKYRMSLLLAVLGVGTAIAQDTYEAAEIASSDLSGTARYVGMGGALGALGGDISTMGTNPAGIALFRHNEAALSASGLFTNSAILGHDRQRMSFDQAGIVFALSQENPSNRGLQYVNFGVNFSKNRNHLNATNVTHVRGLNTGFFSQTWQVADLTNTCAANNYDFGLLPGIFAPTFDDKGQCHHNGILGYDDETQFFYGTPATDASYQSFEYGSADKCDFNASINISDRFFWGVSLGVYDNNYKRETLYGELGADGNYYDILNTYHSKAEGFDLKTGFICRPFPNSPFRIGLTIHTPTWYDMDDVNGYDIIYNEGTTLNPGTPDEIYGYRLTDITEPFRYSYRTPWKFGVSLGHTFGHLLALGADYEYTDPSTARYSDEDWEQTAYTEYLNNKIKHQLRSQHTLRLGAELKPTPELSLRLGYNHVTSPIKKNAYRYLDAYYDYYPTETAYTNWGPTERVTLGLGYRFKGGYFDVAYQFQRRKGDFYAFDIDYTDPEGYHTLPSTPITDKRNQIVATLGFKF